VSRRAPRRDRPPPGGGARRDRDRDRPPGPEVLFGRNPVHEALRARRRRVRQVWATAPAAREPWLAGVAVEVVDAEEVERRAGTAAHQGVCALADPYPYADAAALLDAEAPLLVVLDEVQDVQNLGAIVRTAECAGADGVVIPQRRSAEVTPAAAKASAGAVEHLPVARVRNVADFLGEAKAAGLWVYGAAAGPGSVDYLSVDARGGCVLVLGAEGRGLRPRVAGACDALVALPLRGRMESLNVSAAAAALLYGLLQSRLRG
jgi:23S rRNA (guanosine2251-2'-O)-methyltransferase